MSQPEKILIVEDNFVTADELHHRLQEMGFEAISNAYTGGEALELGRLEQPELVLMDIHLGAEEDGITVAEKIIRVSGDTAVIFITAYDDEKTLNRAREVFPFAYIRKPFSARDLMITIQLALAKRDKQIALREKNEQLATALRELKEAQEQLIEQERLSALGHLAAGMAHDYNNFMASIVLYVDLMLQNEALASVDRGRLEIIREQAEKTSGLTQKIVDFTRQTMMQREIVNITEFLKNQLAEWMLFTRPPADVRVNIPDQPFLLDCDVGRIWQVLQNLLDNSLYAVQDNQGKITVTLVKEKFTSAQPVANGVMPAGNYLNLTVADTGTGIDPVVMPHIFEPFFTTNAPVSHGLGLAQVYGIVLQHDGYLAAQSEVGMGTIFTLYFPLIN